jgi:broad specificity phosphatase PhoE
MARVTLVRHAQASFLQPNYDQLCSNGETQARLLGEYWAQRGVRFSHVWTGPCARQVQTARMVEEAYRSSGRDFPKLEIVDEFNEYPGEAVLRQGLPRLLENSQEIRCAHQLFENTKDIDERKKIFQKLFEAVVSGWVGGELEIAGVETWSEFCVRAERGLERIELMKKEFAGVRNGMVSNDVVIFTSGGPIAVAVRRALHLSDADTLRMTWMSRNASFSEFLSSSDRFTVSTFNATPHLDEKSLLTYR